LLASGLPTTGLPCQLIGERLSGSEAAGKSLVSDAVFPSTKWSSKVFSLTDRDNTAVIRAAEEKLKQSLPDAERASLLSEIGWWHRDMGRLQEAKHALETSLALVPGHYETVKQLLATLTKLGDKPATLDLISRLLRLDPHNPTVFDDCILYARGSSVSLSELDGIRLAPVCRAVCAVRLRNRVPVWVPPVAAGTEGDGEGGGCPAHRFF